METIFIVLEELDRSIVCSRWWGKDDTYTALTELKQRIEYRVFKTRKDFEARVTVKTLNSPDNYSI